MGRNLEARVNAAEGAASICKHAARRNYIPGPPLKGGVAVTGSVHIIRPPICFLAAPVRG